MKRLLLLLLLLPLGAIAETPLGVPLLGPAPEVQFGSALASDGEGYLAVWIDHRTRFRELRAARLDAEGRAVDTTGIHVVAGDAHDPLAIWTGTSYLVVWNATADHHAWGARIDRDGTVIDGPRVLVENGEPASLASNGSHVVLGYLHQGGDVRALFLTPDGQSAGELTLSRGPGPHSPPHVVQHGSQFVAVWTSRGSPDAIEGVHFTIAGPAAAPRRIAEAAYVYEPKLATDGTSFVLLSRHEWLGGYAVRSVSSDLTTTAPHTLLPEVLRANATILWTGSHYIVAAGDSGAAVRAVRVDGQGRPLDSEAAVVENPPAAGSTARPAMATNGRSVLVSWSGAVEYKPATAIDVWATEIDPATLTRRSRALLSASAAREESPAAAAGRTSVLAAWTDDSGLLVRRLRKDGSPLDPQPLRLTDRDVVATVVFNGTDYVVAWREGMDLVTRRIPHDGELRADGGGRVAGGDWNMAAASDGTTTLLVWGGGGLWAVRLAPDGSVLDRFTPLKIADRMIGSVDVAVNDRGEFLVTWGELEYDSQYSPRTTSVRVRGARITSGLQSLDGTGFDIADTSAPEGAPAVAWNGREWFVVWTELPTGLRGRRVAANGTLDGPDTLIAAGAARGDVAWDGSRYVFSWVAPGALHAGGRILGTPEPWMPFAPVLAPVGAGEVMAVYTRISADPAHGGVARAFAEVVRLAPPRRRAARF